MPADASPSEEVGVGPVGHLGAFGGATLQSWKCDLSPWTALAAALPARWMLGPFLRAAVSIRGAVVDSRVVRKPLLKVGSECDLSPLDAFLRTAALRWRC